jgi:hypothetical protein
VHPPSRRDAAAQLRITMATTDLVFQTIDWHEADDPDSRRSAHGRRRRRAPRPMASSPACSASTSRATCSASASTSVTLAVRSRARARWGSSAAARVHVLQRGHKTFMEVEFPSIAEFTRAQFLRDNSLKARLYD